MSFYGASNQQSGPPSGGQRTGSVSAHNLQGAQTNPVDVLPSQLFSFTQNQLQFQPGAHNVSFQDPNNPQLQMQNLQLTAGAPQLLLQQQQQNFPNLNVNFLTEQIGVGQILQPTAVSQSQSMSMQNLITPMSVALSGGMSFAQANNIQSQPPPTSSQQSQQAKQRVFTGTVTKTHDNFGFIDEEVFFQMSVVKGVVLPKPGDRVLVEADFNPAMPFKWNATRVQIVNIGGLNSNLPNMNLNPGGKPPSPQPMTHGSQSAPSMLSQHSSAASAANLLNMNFSQQNHAGSQKNNQPSPSSLASSQSVLSSAGHGQGGPPQSQGNNRYQPSSNPVSIVSNPHSAYGVRNNPRTEDNSRAHVHARTQRQRAPPPPVSAPAPPMVSLSSMVDPHTMQQLQVPLPLQLPMQVPIQIPSLLQLERDREMDKMERERDIRERERERERDRERERQERDREREKEHERRDRERERERSIEREKEREKEREREYERKREREREREREKQKRLKEEPKRERDKDREREKRDVSPGTRSAGRNRSPIALIRDGRKRSRSRSKGRDKEKDSRDRSKSRSNSPKRLTVLTRAAPRYGWELPKVPLDVTDVNVSELKRRYRNLYIPSDFILAKCSWQETFPLHEPMDLNHPCPIHIFRRHTEKINLTELSFKPKQKTIDDIPNVLNPSDENDTLKVKVILLSMPNKTTFYRKACGLAENSTDNSLQHPNRLINFVVGTKMAKNETMIIGGSWSPSLDGPNPVSDPQVLINTAVRTTKALTGLDLRRCTKWYRFMELYYRRGNGTIETVIVFLPNIWAALPSRREWEEMMRSYREVLGGDGSKEIKSEEKKPGEASGASAVSSSSSSSSKDPRPSKTQEESSGNSSLSASQDQNPTSASSAKSPAITGGTDKDKSEDDTPKTTQNVSMVKMEALLEEADVEENEFKEEQEKKEDDIDIYDDLPPGPAFISTEESQNEEHEQASTTGTDTEKPDGEDISSATNGTATGCVSESDKQTSTAEAAVSTEKGDTCSANVTGFSGEKTILVKDICPESSEPIEESIAATRTLHQDATVNSSVADESGSLESDSNQDRSEENEIVSQETGDSTTKEGKGTHFSLLDPKHMTVIKLREELELRGATTKGLKKNQLVTRLAKILKVEESSESGKISGLDKIKLEQIVDKDQEPDESMDVDESQLLNGPPPMETENGGDVSDTEAMENHSSRDSVTQNTDMESVVSGRESLLESEKGGSISTQVGDAITTNERCEKTNQSQSKQPKDASILVEDSKSVTAGASNRSKKVGLTYQVPVMPEGVTDKTRKVWERRYALPKYSHLLIHPSKEAKGGIFDCNQHSLNTLRDYRLADNKEQSFEVSLCSEFFHEMLQRDFAFRIYREIVHQTSFSEDKEDKSGGQSSVSKDESPTKKRKISTSSSVTGTVKATSKTVDPYLLLAFIFFDHTRCGYITDGDLEDLCLSLGLGLSRSQIRKLIQKVCTKGNLHYRKWTDASVEEGSTPPDPGTRDDSSTEHIVQLSQEYKTVLPLYGKPKENGCNMEFQDIVLQLENGENIKKETESLLAACDSDVSLVDVKKLRDQLEKSEKDRASLESNLKLIKSSLDDAKIQMGELRKSNESTKEELNRTKDSIKRFEGMESSAQNEVEIFRKASERFLDRVKDFVKLPVQEIKGKDSKLIKDDKDHVKKDKSDTENSSTGVSES